VIAPSANKRSDTALGDAYAFPGFRPRALVQTLSIKLRDVDALRPTPMKRSLHRARGMPQSGRSGIRLALASSHRLHNFEQVTVILKFVTRSEGLFGLVIRIPLLRKFFVYRADAMSELRSAIVRDYVYRAFLTSNATSKQTSAGRFEDLDRVACSIITDHKLGDIHDIGVSSGVTSLELYRALAATGIPLNFHISDKYAVYGSTGRHLVRIVDTDGSVTELYLCGVLGKHDVTNKFPVTRFLYWLLADRPVGDSVRWFVLFDREVQEHLQRGLIHRIDYDVFTTRMPSAFSFVRCMNLLNLGYFPHASIETALRNVIESLKEGGVLQIGRTHPNGISHAAFYNKRGTRLELRQEIGKGTELRELIEKL
jgi:hypothetical protein